ncbi:hypothetical protein M431DRAFT_504917, partial [Trichoderma harzianum CBS 226.95]
MEQVHGVDVSWMTQGSPKGRLLCHSHRCVCHGAFMMASCISPSAPWQTACRAIVIGN